jgi:predicted Ser/Thr protein kinase
MQAGHAPVKKKLLELLEELMAHDGFGSIKVDIRLLKRGQKEVIIDCGKQYRYVIDFEPALEK